MNSTLRAQLTDASPSAVPDPSSLRSHRPQWLFDARGCIALDGAQALQKAGVLRVPHTYDTGRMASLSPAVVPVAIRGQLIWAIKRADIPVHITKAGFFTPESRATL